MTEINIDNFAYLRFVYRMDNFSVVLIDTRLDKDDIDSTIESFEEEEETEVEEGLDKTFEIIEDSDDSSEVKEEDDESPEIPRILESFGKKAGFGSNLMPLLPEDRKESSDAVAAFLIFVLERQKIWVNKSRGVAPLTENLVLGGKWFTNMYRELDRGTIYFKRQMMKTSLKGLQINREKISDNLVEEILFKSILYRLLNRVETFIDFGKFPAFARCLGSWTISKRGRRTMKLSSLPPTRTWASTGSSRLSVRPV